jgi:hypothetical protein
MMTEKEQYIIRYEISNPQGEIIYQGQVEGIKNTGEDLDLNSQEQKEILESSIFWELGVKVNSIERKEGND